MTCLMNTSSNQWPHRDTQPYMPEFMDGWQPPMLSAEPIPRESVSRVEVVQPAPIGVRGMAHSQI